MTTDDRRNALRAASPHTVNGIDFVEVDPVSDTTLVVHFILNLPDAPNDPVPPGAPGDALGPANFAITGGERITKIGVVSATRIADDQMKVVVDQAGDFSVYTVWLTDGAGGTPPGFDTQSASADFLFHIDCANAFDCGPGADCPTEYVPPPRINYLARDYPGFVQVMLDRLSLLVPGWRERNPADLGVALVETLAYVGDHLSYRQDAIATEAYLGTARLRTSIRRHARLVDYRIGEGANARAWLRIFLNNDAAPLPARTRCATLHPGAVPPLLAREALAYQQAVNAGAVFFETTAPSDPLFLKHQEMKVYNWSNAKECVPVGATHATLDGAFPNLATGMVLILAEARGPLTGDAADADSSHRQAVRLTKATVTADRLNDHPVTEIDWHPDDALAFALCVSSVTDALHGARPITGVAVAWGNIVLADQGRCIGVPSDPLNPSPEDLGTVPPHGRFRPSLAAAPLTFAAAAPDPTGPASAAVADPGTAVAQVRAKGGTDALGTPLSWTATPDLIVGPAGQNFVPEVEADGTAHLLFGDGINGLRPEPGTSFTAIYRVGNGSSGNVARDAIALLGAGSLPAGVVGVTNPLPAWGGVDPEAVEHVRQSAPVAFRSQRRAVTAEDYQRLAMGFRGVQRAAATLRWTGSWHTVFLTIERDRQAPVGPAFIHGLEAYLDGYRMAGVDLEVEDGVRVPLDVQMSVCVKPDYVATDVGQALLAVFSARTLPDGTEGLFSPSRLDLGQPFFLSPLYAAAQAVDGVASVQILKFERQDQPSLDGLSRGVLVPGRLEFFVLDNDPNFPERGRFDLTVEGGL